MQPSSVCSFRNRLKRKGYTSIHIKRIFIDGSEFWHVSAFEPLFHTFVSGDLTITQCSMAFFDSRL